MSNFNARSGLMAKVYAKIAAEFGLEKPFSHWDFNELLGDNPTYQRGRIGGRFLYMYKMGALEKVREVAAGGGRGKHSYYRALAFPLRALNAQEVEGRGLTNQSKLDLDALFFNLGKPTHQQVNIRGALTHEQRRHMEISRKIHTCGGWGHGGDED